jgi:hypothetical protein
MVKGTNLRKKIGGGVALRTLTCQTVDVPVKSHPLVLSLL